MVNIRRATLADAIDVAPRLREADRDECKAYLGLTPEVVLPLNVEEGETWAVEGNDGKVFGLFGVSQISQHSYFGLVWMVSTPDIFKYRRELVSMAPVLLEKLHNKYPLLGNHIDARNMAHIRWLKRMGFSFLRTLPEFGVEKRPFHEFARLRS